MSNTKKPKTVDEYLNEVDYSEINNYVPSEFALNLINLIKLIEGGDPENKSPVVHLRMLDNFVVKNKDVINLCHRGLAKALSLDTTVITSNGRVTVADLKVGEQIFGEDGKLTTVTHKSEVFDKPMYRITLVDGRTLDVSEDHINVIIQQRQKRVNGKRVNYLDRRELTTKELLKLKLTTTRSTTSKNPKGKENRIWIPLSSPLELPTKDFTIDPYTLGVLLGDGCLSGGSPKLCSHKDDLPFYKSNMVCNFGAENVKENTYLVGIKGIKHIIADLGVNCHGDYKFVPKEYLFGSVEQRLSILQGLMDTDGTCYTNGCSAFTSNSHQLVLDVCYLVQSLGGYCTVGRTGKAYRANVSLNMPMFRLPRKLSRQSFKVKDKIAIQSIESIDQVPSQCIRVDNKSHTFIANDFVVTHNTTLVEYLMWYIAIFNKLPNLGVVPYALYVSDSIDNGIKRMRKSIENRYNQSDFLKQMIPKMSITDTRWEFINVDNHKFVVTGHGAKSGVRGTRENNSRPVLALLDDLLSDDDARSPTVIASIEETIYNAIEFALHPTKRKMIWNGTPFHAGDPLYKAVESGSWAVNVYPVCEKFPCKPKEFKGSWEDRFTHESLKRTYDKMKGLGRLDSFEQELMLRIYSNEDRVIEDADIQWYDRDLLIKNKDNYNFYITTDFATSEKRSADFSVISVWAYNHQGYWFWVDGICAKQLMDKNLDDLFTLAQIYKPQSVGIEVTGQQGGFVTLIQREMITRNIFFNLASEGNANKAGIRPNTQKFARFMTIVPWFKSKMFFFPEQLKETETMRECMTELRLISRQGFKSKHDDFIDTISMLSALTTWKPSENISYSFNDASGIWEEEDDNTYENGLETYII